MRRDLIAAIALAFAACAALAPGRASAGEKIAVLDVAMTGVPEDVRPRFERSLEEGLRGAGFVVVPRSTVIERLIQRDAPEGCAFGPCLAAVGRALGVELALAARITAQGPSYSFVFTMVDTVTGAPTVQVTDACPVCTLDEALAAATLSVVSLGTKSGPAAEVLPAATWRERHRAQQRRIRTAGGWLTGIGFVGALGGGAVFLVEDKPVGAGVIGLGVGMAITGLTLLLVAD